jgi:hypothetical protein
MNVFGGVISLSLREEKAKLEGQLAGVPAAFNRLKQVCKALHEKSVFIEKGIQLSEVCISTHQHHVTVYIGYWFKV